MSLGCSSVEANSVRPGVGSEVRVQGVEDEEVIEAELSEEAREPKKVHNPALPSRAEMELHMLTHLPFRSWCEHCVRGRGESVRHEKVEELPEQVEVHMDFFFMGEEGSEQKLTILAARERQTRMTMSTVVPTKGDNEFMAKRVQAFLREIGADKGDITVKSDQEPAMMAVLNEVCRHRAAEGGGRTVTEHSAVGDSKGNGIIERAIKSIEGQIRVAKSALEARLKAKLDQNHAVLTWLVEYVSMMLNRYEVSRDGRTAYERSKGKKSRLAGLEFGEQVMWRRKPVGNNLAKLSVMWDLGTYLGVKGSTGEIIIGTESGVWRTRTVRRRPEELRWNAAEVDKVKEVPWDRHVNKKEDEVIEPRGGMVMMPAELQEQEKQAVREELTMPKAFHTSKDDYDRYGYSRGCPGCRALLTGTTRQKHTAQCRQRMEKAMGDLDRVKAAKRRREEFLTKVTVPTGDPVAADDGQCLKQCRKSGAIGADFGQCVKDPEDHDGMKVEEPASGSGLNEGERKRGWEQADWQDLVNRIKRKSVAEPEVKNEGDGMDIDGVDIGNFEVNAEGDEFEDWGHDEFEDGEFDPVLLKEARMEEVRFMEKIGVWEPATWEECMQKTGRPPITTKWVDVDKGRGGEVLVRSRLVARDFKIKGDDRGFDVFAATPPLELKRLLFRMARVKGSVGGGDDDGAVKLMFIDVKKAHLNGEVAEDEFAYVLLTKEAGGGVGRLRRWLYGMRPAASAWEDHYAEKLKEAGFVRGRAAPTSFVNPETGVRVVVWGDDFTFLGREKHLKDMADKMADWYEIKVRAMMGPDPGDDKEVRILNRVIKWERDKITYVADDKHVVRIMDELGFDDDTKGVDMPIKKGHDEGDFESDEPLDAAEARRYRRLAATINYLAMDRPDLQFTASVLGRTMAKPTERSWANLKRAARYLKAHATVVLEYPEVETVDVKMIVAYSDSDWAGCKTSRRSTSGGLVTLGGSILRSWSNRQSTIALSSGEAEFHSASKAAAELMAVSSMMNDLGWPVERRLFVDASAAQAMSNRQGIGKLRHLEVKFLWLQDLAKAGVLAVRKISGQRNPADVLTKPMGFADMLAKLALVQVSA
jgi:hypothetical protein